MKRAKPRSRGFTLVELLVVIAIIGVLVALLLPAIQAARESARRSQCSNNLKQVALGLNLHVSNFGQFPATYYGGYGCTPPAGGYKVTSMNWSFLARILPFVEQTSLYDACRISDSIGGYPEPTNINEEYEIPEGVPGTIKFAGEENTGAVVSSYLCPSDGESTIGAYRATNFHMMGRGRSSGTMAGISNYHGCGGSMSNYQALYINPGTERAPSQPGFPEDHAWNTSPFRNGDGILFPSSFLKPRRPARISDGLSHTFLVGEDVFGRNFYGHNWVHSVGSFRLTNCPINLRDEMGRFRTNHIDLGFYSYHPSGANFALADGSVIYISEDIELGTLRALGTVSGAEITSL